MLSQSVQPGGKVQYHVPVTRTPAADAALRAALLQQVPLPPTSLPQQQQEVPPLPPGVMGFPRTPAPAAPRR